MVAQSLTLSSHAFARPPNARRRPSRRRLLRRALARSRRSAPGRCSQRALGAVRRRVRRRWCSTLLAEEEATASAAAPAPADSVTVQVNSELVAHGCCQKGRLAFLGTCSNYLYHKRKTDEAGARVQDKQRRKRLLPAALAILSDPCSLRCGAELTPHVVELLRSEYDAALDNASRPATERRADAELVLKRFMYDSQRDEVRPYCSKLLMQLVPVGTDTLTRLRRELHDDGLPRAHVREDGMLLWRRGARCSWRAPRSRSCGTRPASSGALLDTSREAWPRCAQAPRQRASVTGGVTALESALPERELRVWCGVRSRAIMTRDTLPPRTQSRGERWRPMHTWASRHGRRWRL